MQTLGMWQQSMGVCSFANAGLRSAFAEAHVRVSAHGLRTPELGYASVPGLQEARARAQGDELVSDVLAPCSRWSQVLVPAWSPAKRNKGGRVFLARADSA
eukprot:14961696-Alexandrium_andersonii.AAC.1